MLFIANLLLTYIFSIFLSGSVFTFFTIKGRYLKKFQGFVISSLPLIVLFIWGYNLKQQQYIWWFLAIIAINLIIQFNHNRKKDAELSNA